MRYRYPLGKSYIYPGSLRPGQKSLSLRCSVRNGLGCNSGPKYLVQYTGRLNWFNKDNFVRTMKIVTMLLLFSDISECAIRFKEHSLFLCIDDKHKAKVGEPGYPVAAAERGR